ncbi:MAG: hypothetical protein ACYDEY_13815 [Acidimicrobiales bacterium]
MTALGSPGDSRQLDLTTESTNAEKAAPVLKTIEEKREDTRRAVAFVLLAALAAVVIGWTTVGLWGDGSARGAAEDALKTAFAGLLGLTGTVVGFYFGGVTKNQ